MNGSLGGVINLELWPINLRTSHGVRSLLVLSSPEARRIDVLNKLGICLLQGSEVKACASSGCNKMKTTTDNTCTKSTGNIGERLCFLLLYPFTYPFSFPAENIAAQGPASAQAPSTLYPLLLTTTETPHPHQQQQQPKPRPHYCATHKFIICQIASSP